MQLMIKEVEKKAKKAGDEYDELAFMDKILSMLIGQKSLDSINEMDLPLPEYKIIYSAIMASATGQSLEEVEKDQRFQQ